MNFAPQGAWQDFESFFCSTHRNSWVHFRSILSHPASPINHREQHLLNTLVRSWRVFMSCCFQGLQCDAVWALGADLKTAAPIGSRVNPASARRVALMWRRGVKNRRRHRSSWILAGRRERGTDATILIRICAQRVSAYQAGQVSLPCVKVESSSQNFTHNLLSDPTASLSATRMYLPVIKAAPHERSSSHIC